MCCTSDLFMAGNALLLVQEADQFLAATGLLKFAYRLGFDLANSLAGNLENMPHFFQRVAITISQAVTQLDNFAFTIAERF